MHTYLSSFHLHMPVLVLCVCSLHVLACAVILHLGQPPVNTSVRLAPEARKVNRWPVLHSIEGHVVSLGWQVSSDKPEDVPDKVDGLREHESEIKTVAAADTIYQSATSFDELGLSPELLQGGSLSPRCVAGCRVIGGPK